ncbi:MAG: SH3 domain-containing protein [Gemmatimonadetes bacterium]|nr:SH3 domain-containing protein [Gemmatimonadota bacterium]
MRIFNLMPVLTLTAVLALGRQTVAAQSATSSALVRTNAVVRSQASQSGERIGLLRAGEEVVVLQEVPGWKRVRTSSTSGWVASRLLSPPQHVATQAVAVNRPDPVPPRCGATAPCQALAEPAAAPPLVTDSSAPPAATSATAPEGVPGMKQAGPWTFGGRLWIGAPAIGIFGETTALTRKVFRPGTIGLSASADYVSVPLFGSGVLVSAMVNYHVRLPTAPRLDPFVGAGIGFGAIAGFSGIDLLGHAGARYFFTDRLGLHANINVGRAGYGGLAIGVAGRR